LRPTTQARLVGHARRLRAVADRIAQALPITRYEVQTHGLGFLTYWWSVAREHAEHIDLLGSVAADPVQFLQAYAPCDIMVVHEQEADWTHWQGVVAIAWSSDVVPRARYRLDYWVAHPYRHPKHSLQIARGVLDYLFQIRQFAFVYGITPVTNRLALRLLIRLGLRDQEIWPLGTINPHTGAPLDAIITRITREAWQHRAEGV
jgi:hypothetical protein